MTRLPRALLAGTLVLVAAGFLTPAAQADDNVIADANLKACINTTINRPTDTAVTAADLAPLANLDCSNRNIASLEGMQYYNTTYLLWLQFQDNQITDISPLVGLNVGWLEVQNNKISDLTPVSTFTNLNSLAVNNNLITDPSPISGLPKLQLIGLSDNQIVDLSGLTSLPFATALNLNDNNISDVSPLAIMSAPNLNSLSLSRNSISDLSLLEPFYADSLRHFRLSALDQQVRLPDAGVGQAQPIPAVEVVGQDPSIYKPVPVLDGHTLTMTPPSTTNVSIDESSGKVTYLAAGVYEWTWVAGTPCEAENPILEPTCWPFVNYSGTATVTVSAPGTDGGMDGTDNGTGGTDAGDATTGAPVAASTGGTATSTTPLAGTLLIAAGIAVLIVRRQVSHSTR